MKLFPAFLDLARRPCLVVGGGKVGTAKTETLLAAGARVLVVDPSPSEELLAEAERDSRVSVEGRAFRDDDCRGRFLVFACTDRAVVNDAVAAAASNAGALCCRADGAEGDFTTGATLRRGDVCVAVSSGGSSPGLAIEARRRIEAVVGREFGEAARLLGELRAEVRGEARAEVHADAAAGGARAEALGGALARDVVAALERGNAAEAERLVAEALAGARRGGTGRSEDRCTR